MPSKAGWRRPAPEIVRLVRALAVDDARRDHEAATEHARRRRGETMNATQTRGRQG